MTIKEGLKLKGKKIEIPNVGRDDLATFFAEQGYKVGAEIGVDQGLYTKVLCDAGMKVYGVDAWEDYEGYQRKGKYANHIEEAQDNVKGLDCELIHKYSMDALDGFEDESLDFVYIDANHTLPHVINDVWFWEHKVRKGGIVAGHDYAMISGGPERPDRPRDFDGCHVQEAIDTLVSVMRVPQLVILGERFPKEPNWRDIWRSWFWIKER